MKNLNEVYMYLIKIGPDRFKYGFSWRPTTRLQQVLRARGLRQGRLIATSARFVSRNEALALESEILNGIVGGKGNHEEANLHQSRKILSLYEEKLGLVRHLPITVSVNPNPLEVGDAAIALVTKAIICTADACTTNLCMYAQSLLALGFTSIDIQVNLIKANRDGFRYFFEIPEVMNQGLEAFDDPKKRAKLQPHKVAFKVIGRKQVTFRAGFARKTNPVIVVAKKVTKKAKPTARRYSGRSVAAKREQVKIAQTLYGKAA